MRTPPVIREHRIPSDGSKPYIAVEGPDGNLWFCESGTSKIGCLDTQSGEFREFALPSADSTPVGIDTGADGNLWFTEKTGNRVGRLRRDGTRNSRCRGTRQAPTVSLAGRMAISGFPPPK